MTRDQIGLKAIDDAEWIKGEFNELNLHLTDNNGKPLHCWLELRPVYCDRGHIQLNIDGHIYLDGADSFPRFFFSFKEADTHLRTFLKWRLWKHRIHEHKLEVES